MNTSIERGFLVLADISGFTAFVTTTELEHGTAIIAELLEAVMRRLAPPLEIQELEGDAVFALGPDGFVTPPGGLLDVLDGAVAGFRERQREMVGAETCACDACQRTAMLDLKIVAHHGSFVRQAVGGRRQVAGANVILAHRLLKNGLSPRAGYLLLTQAAVDALGLDPIAVGLEPHSETYEHLGLVRCFVGVPEAEPASAAGRAVAAVAHREG